MKLKVIGALFFFPAILIYSCGEQDINFKRYYTTGNVVYTNKCQNCHGSDGQGLSALIPSLTDTVFLHKNKSLLPCFIKYGLKGKILIIGKKAYDGDMPPVDLSPIEIAEVLTYVGNSFGNNMGLISQEEVQKDLEKCRY